PDQGGPSSAWHGNIASGSARVHNGNHYGDATYNITSTTHDNADWDSLKTWLEEEGSIYWVCGKAGSGKSTLMAPIVEDYRTIQCLCTWAHGRPLHVLRFFFWRPGTELQKSINGLLRTILYQICTEVGQVVQKVAMAVRWQPGRQVSWSDKRLNLAIEAALTSSEDVFCFFLDGLDEFVGDLSSLTDLINQLGALENVKLCVSSRPEAELKAHFSTCKQLRLERLNRADIEKFVISQLHRLQHNPVFTRSKSESYLGFIGEVVHRADGVFLWTVLVLPTLIRGIVSGDDWNMLHTRLHMTPVAINDLYAIDCVAIPRLATPNGGPPSHTFSAEDAAKL
ncbi:hypothetical protein HII31_10448, partial [Pseudocercospora fuligena]